MSLRRSRTMASYRTSTDMSLGSRSISPEDLGKRLSTISNTSSFSGPIAEEPLKRSSSPAPLSIAAQLRRTPRPQSPPVWGSSRPTSIIAPAPVPEGMHRCQCGRLVRLQKKSAYTEADTQTEEPKPRVIPDWVQRAIEGEKRQDASTQTTYVPTAHYKPTLRRRPSIELKTTPKQWQRAEYVVRMEEAEKARLDARKKVEERSTEAAKEVDWVERMQWVDNMMKHYRSKTKPSYVLRAELDEMRDTAPQLLPRRSSWVARIDAAQAVGQWPTGPEPVVDYHLMPKNIEAKRKEMEEYLKPQRKRRRASYVMRIDAAQSVGQWPLGPEPVIDRGAVTSASLKKEAEQRQKASGKTHFEEAPSTAEPAIKSIAPLRTEQCLQQSWVQRAEQIERALQLDTRHGNTADYALRAQIAEQMPENKRASWVMRISAAQAVGQWPIGPEAVIDRGPVTARQSTSIQRVKQAIPTYPLRREEDVVIKSIPVTKPQLWTKPIWQKRMEEVEQMLEEDPSRSAHPDYILRARYDETVAGHYRRPSWIMRISAAQSAGQWPIGPEAVIDRDPKKLQHTNTMTKPRLWTPPVEAPEPKLKKVEALLPQLWANRKWQRRMEAIEEHLQHHSARGIKPDYVIRAEAGEKLVDKRSSWVMRIDAAQSVGQWPIGPEPVIDRDPRKEKATARAEYVTRAEAAEKKEVAQPLRKEEVVKTVAPLSSDQVLVSKDWLRKMQELETKVAHLSRQNATPEYILRARLSEQDLSDPTPAATLTSQRPKHVEAPKLTSHPSWALRMAQVDRELISTDQTHSATPSWVRRAVIDQRLEQMMKPRGLPASPKITVNMEPKKPSLWAAARKVVEEKKSEASWMVKKSATTAVVEEKQSKVEALPAHLDPALTHPVFMTPGVHKLPFPVSSFASGHNHPATHGYVFDKRGGEEDSGSDSGSVASGSRMSTGTDLTTPDEEVVAEKPKQLWEGVRREVTARRVVGMWSAGERR